ncbi:hypothetical protein GCM10009849_31230 [Sinomonas flava]|uniref:Uncharacterized protein n=1 Tax=Sinomonas flava TaxID=496857 RepID=A0ABN3C1H3_9MICC
MGRGCLRVPALDAPKPPSREAAEWGLGEREEQVLQLLGGAIAVAAEARQSGARA